ncbi:LAFA_0G13630g1_1 [Lachancea sp. 'fantastica']|nr:LAFA_0G13630g1_1 [Lachancea sp. 'fantastica']
MHTMPAKSKRPAFNELDNLMDGIEAFIGNSGTLSDLEAETSEDAFGNTVLYSESNNKNLVSNTAIDENDSEPNADGDLVNESVSIVDSGAVSKDQKDIEHSESDELQDDDKSPVSEAKESEATEINENSVSEAKKSPISKVNKAAVAEGSGSLVDEANENLATEARKGPVSEASEKPAMEARKSPVSEANEKPVDEAGEFIESEAKKSLISEANENAASGTESSPVSEANEDAAFEGEKNSIAETNKIRIIVKEGQNDTEHPVTVHRDASTDEVHPKIFDKIIDNASAEPLITETASVTNQPDGFDSETAIEPKVTRNSADIKHNTVNDHDLEPSHNVSASPTDENDPLQNSPIESSKAAKPVQDKSIVIPIKVSSDEKIETPPKDVTSQPLSSEPQDEETSAQQSPPKSGLVTLKNLAENSTIPEKEASLRAEKQGLFTLEELSKPNQNAEEPATEKKFTVPEQNVSGDAQCSPKTLQELAQTTPQEMNSLIGDDDEKSLEKAPENHGSLFTLNDLHPNTQEKSLIDPGFKDTLSSYEDKAIVTLKDLTEKRSDLTAGSPKDAPLDLLPNDTDHSDDTPAAASSTVAAVAAEIEDLLREMQEEEPSKLPQTTSFIPTAQESTTTKEIRELLKDEPVYVYTSLAGGGYLMPSRTNRLAQILTANQVTFTYRDLGTDDEARQVWKRHGRGRSLPAVVRGRDDIVGNWEEMDDANEEYRVRELIYETL